MLEYTPQHAVRALEIIIRLLPHVTPYPEYMELAEVLKNHDRWHEAHALFNRIRTNITIPCESHRLLSVNDAFVYVAENAAKTAYNCSGRSAPFDNASFFRLLKAEERFLAIQDSSNTGVE